MMLGIHVYLGPSLDLETAKKILPKAYYHPPVRCGDLISLLRLSPSRIIIIDGLYETVPAVWHKEILLAMELGIEVWGAIKDSIAAKTWSPGYFNQILGEKQVALSLWSPADYVNNQFYHLKKVKFTIQQIMDLFIDDETINSLSGRFYMQNHPLNEFESIRDHIAPPAFCDLINLTQFAPHLWCGQNDTLTQLHFDELDNIFLQVHGQKSVTLFHPDDTRFLFQYKPEKTIGLRNVHRSRIPGTDLLDHYASMHRHATPYHVHMRETDALFIPKHWWHEVRGLSGSSISVNYWFHTNADYLPDVESHFSSEWMSYSIPEKEALIFQVSTLLFQHNCPNYVFERMPFTLMQVAIRFNLIEVIEKLLLHPRTELCHAPFNCSPLFLAIVFEHQAILALLLKNRIIRGTINNEFPGYGCTPLALAVETGHSGIVKQLIECGAVLGE